MKTLSVILFSLVLNISYAFEQAHDLADLKHQTQILTHGQKANKVLIIMHGLHESPYYMRSFSQSFYKRGHNVISLLLPGHQRFDKSKLNTITAEEWIVAAENALSAAKGLGEQIEILGYSTGGTLAMYLALNYPKQIKKLYLIAPALALADRIFLATLSLGWSHIDSRNLCSSYNDTSILCRVLKYSDHEAGQMVKEGLVVSPSAGTQVQQLVNIIDKKFYPYPMMTEEDRGGYYIRLSEIYHSLQIPIFMVNSEADRVVTPNFNQEFILNYNGKKDFIFFDEKYQISHTMISKSAMDAYKTSAETQNPQFDKLLNRMMEFSSY